MIIGEPEAAKHVLKAYGKYSKGLVAEVAEFLFGSGFAIAEGELWSVSVQTSNQVSQSHASQDQWNESLMPVAFVGMAENHTALLI